MRRAKDFTQFGSYKEIVLCASLLLGIFIGNIVSVYKDIKQYYYEKNAPISYFVEVDNQINIPGFRTNSTKPSIPKNLDGIKIFKHTPSQEPYKCVELGKIVKFKYPYNATGERKNKISELALLEARIEALERGYNTAKHENFSGIAANCNNLVKYANCEICYYR